MGVHSRVSLVWFLERRKTWNSFPGPVFGMSFMSLGIMIGILGECCSSGAASSDFLAVAVLFVSTSSLIDPRDNAVAAVEIASAE